jgi:hypothetical protein
MEVYIRYNKNKNEIDKEYPVLIVNNEHNFILSLEKTKQIIKELSEIINELEDTNGKES